MSADSNIMPCLFLHIGLSVLILLRHLLNRIGLHSTFSQLWLWLFNLLHYFFFLFLRAWLNVDFTLELWIVPLCVRESPTVVLVIENTRAVHWMNRRHLIFKFANKNIISYLVFRFALLLLAVALLVLTVSLLVQAVSILGLVSLLWLRFILKTVNLSEVS